MKNKKKTQRWVIKIGSSLLTNNGKGINCKVIGQWVEQIAYLKHHLNYQVILVSSGAVAEGMSRLNWTTRPKALHELQAVAAIGQMGLIQAYENCFMHHDIKTAQILLTHDDLSNRQRYLNSRSTLRTLLSLGTVPIVNENDTVVTDEIQFGDNDTLGALVANLIEADALVILTDQKGLYNKNPATHKDPTLIKSAQAEDKELISMADRPGKFGTGGMITKISAAKLAARSGTYTVIMAGNEPDGIRKLANGDNIGTHLRASQETMTARKCWLAGQLKVKGELIIDAGAEKGLCQSGGSLLAVGITSVSGKFDRGELVSCINHKGIEIARGLTNYNTGDINQIKTFASNRIEKILGYVDEPEVIHRDNLVLL